MGNAVSQEDITSIKNTYATKSYVDSAGATYAKPNDFYPKDQLYNKSESDSRFAKVSDYYNKTDSDGRFAKVSDYYSKGDSDSRFSSKSDVDSKFAKITTDYYNKVDSDARYYNKTDNDARIKTAVDTSIANVYTKTDLDKKYQPGVIDKQTAMTCNANGTCTLPPGKVTVLDFMEGNPNSTRKDPANGTINFGKHDGGGSLNIVGGGKADDRNVRIWGNILQEQGKYMGTKDGIKIGSWNLFEGGDGHLMIVKDGSSDNPNQGFFRFSQDGNIWASRSTSRGWISDNISNLNGVAVKNGDQIRLKGSKWQKILRHTSDYDRAAFDSTNQNDDTNLTVIRL